MTHNEDRTHWFKEGAIGLGVGILYGTTNVAVGHPFDTVKTKMQAQAGFEGSGMFRTFVKTLRTQGIIGLYRGCIPPLWGSGIYRSTQFAVFEAGYTYMDNPFGRWEFPFTGGVQMRVAIAGGFASTARAIIECPLELAKIRRQTGQTWQFKGLYKGFGVTWFRTMGLMTTYFILIDSGRRHCNELFQRPLIGPFLASGTAATLAWWIVWPLEYMKSQVQGNYGKEMPVLQRMRLVIKERGGFFGLYRGLLPGSIRSFLANGTSMVVMAWAQRQVSKMGLRD
ncbi:mitochondrial substrate carrier family protein S-like [Ptychodera flava]|uniref:mitochondrial substrate carrier family protein S-like n=1 Tax=Ptychodera flava TaxID=63121 RepID=UPI00396A8AEF